MTDPVNPLQPLVSPDFQPYKSYLPTAFSDDLSLLQKMNYLINYLNTVTTTVNNAVNTVNGFSSEINTDVVNQMVTWKNDGTLSTIFDQSVFNTLNSQIVSVMNPPTGYTAAKGDGVTDDAPAIQALLNAGYPLFFPDGDYLIKSTLTTPDGTPFRIRGNGKKSRILRGFSGDYMAHVSGNSSQTKEYSEVSNILFDGNSSNNFTGGGLDWSYAHFAYSENLIVLNCKGGAGINFIQSWDCIFYKLTMLDCGDAANQIGATVFQDTNYAACDRIIFFGAHFENNLWSHVQGKNNNGKTNNKIDFIECKFHGATPSMTEYHTGWNVDMTNMFSSHIIGGEFGHGERHLYMDSTTAQCIISKPQLTYQDNTGTPSVQINGSANDLDFFLAGSAGINITGGQNKIKIYPVSITGNLILSNTQTTNYIEVFDNRGFNTFAQGTNLWSLSPLKVLYQSANYTLSMMDDFIVINGTSLVVTLPAAASSKGKQFKIYNKASGTATLQAQSGESIFASASANTYTINGNSSCRVISDGGSWYVI